MQTSFSAIMNAWISSIIKTAATRYKHQANKPNVYKQRKQRPGRTWIKSSSSYYRPHQGLQEIARRKRQIERGILQVTK